MPYHIEGRFASGMQVVCLNICRGHIVIKTFLVHVTLLNINLNVDSVEQKSMIILILYFQNMDLTSGLLQILLYFTLNSACLGQGNGLLCIKY